MTGEHPMSEMLFAENHLFRLRECTFRLRKLPFDSSRILVLECGVRWAVLLHRLRVNRRETIADAAFSLALYAHAVRKGAEHPRGWHRLTAPQSAAACTALDELKKQSERLVVLAGNDTDIRAVREWFGQPLEY